MMTTDEITSAMLDALNEYLVEQGKDPDIAEVYLGHDEYTELMSSVEFRSASKIRYADVPGRFLGFIVYRVNWHRHLRIVIK